MNFDTIYDFLRWCEAQGFDENGVTISCTIHEENMTFDVYAPVSSTYEGFDFPLCTTDGNTQVLLYTNLIVPEDQYLCPPYRCKGMIIWVHNTLNNVGCISMASRGCYAEGQNIYLWKNSDGTYEFVPAQGGVGGAWAQLASVGRVNQTVYGQPGGVSELKRGTGGGAGGAAGGGYNSGPKCHSGWGGQGTSYCGGAGGGSAVTVDQYNYAAIGGNGSNYGGSGGNGWYNGTTSWRCFSGGGQGNPMGNWATRSTGYVTWNGPGGLLIIYCGQYEGEGWLDAKSPNGTFTQGNANNHCQFGGGAGGGSINIFTRADCEIINYVIHGGKMGANARGGDGSFTHQVIGSSHFLIEDNGKIKFFKDNSWFIV